ncbi:MAG: hypothetical protein U0Y68_11925 [Blastocatellia bacterium]
MRYLIIVFMLLAITVGGVSQPAKPAAKQRKAAVEASPEGVVVNGNRARVKPGYEAVRQSDTQVAVRKKKKKPKETPDPTIETASFRCTCSSGGGRCSVSSQGSNIFCDNNTCTSCSLIVTKNIR